jgi:hypothetical protein
MTTQQPLTAKDGTNFAGRCGLSDGILGLPTESHAVRLNFVYYYNN